MFETQRHPKRSYTESTYDPKLMEDLMFTSIIRAIEAEIEWKYVPGAIAWADNNFNNSWSNAIYRFKQAIDTKDLTHLKQEAQIYQNTLINLITKYKVHKNIDQTASFLNSLKASIKIKAEADENET